MEAGMTLRDQFEIVLQKHKVKHGYGTVLACMEISTLQAALRTYGQHRWKCMKLAAIVEVGADGDHEAALVKAAGLPCSCGFTAALGRTDV